MRGAKMLHALSSNIARHLAMLYIHHRSESKYNRENDA